MKVMQSNEYTNTKLIYRSPSGKTEVAIRDESFHLSTITGKDVFDSKEMAALLAALGQYASVEPLPEGDA